MSPLPHGVLQAVRNPNRRSWQELVAWLDRLPEAVADVWSDLLDHALVGWPIRLRVAPWEWVDRIVVGREPPGWKIVRRISLKGWADRHPAVFAAALEDLLGSRTLMARIEEVDLGDNGLQDERLLLALAGARPRRLQRLRLAGNPWRDVGMDAFHADAFPALRALDLSRCGLRPDQLTAPERPTALTELALGDNPGLGGALAATLAAYPALRRLGVPAARLTRSDLDAIAAVASDRAPFHVLDLAHNPLDDADVSRITQAANRLVLDGLPIGPQTLSTLARGAPRALSMAGCGLGPTAIPRLRALPGIEVLDLSSNPLGNRAGDLLDGALGATVRGLDVSHTELGVGAMAALARGSAPRLQRLELAGNRLNQAGIDTLGRLEAPSLASLGLASTFLDEHAVERLAGLPLLARLARLDLSNNRLWSKGIEPLTRRPAPSLRRLGLRGCALGPDGVRALCKAPWRSTLLHLDLAANGLDDRSVHRIARRGLFQRLEELVLADQFGITDAAIFPMGRARGLRRLARLDLRGTRVRPSTAAGLVASAALPQLCALLVTDPDPPSSFSPDVLRSQVLRGSPPPSEQRSLASGSR